MDIDTWKIAKLGSITEVITKGTTPTTIGYRFIDEGINFIKIESISNEGNFLINKMEHISNECNEKMKRSQLKENDILFSIAGAIGRIAIVSQHVLPANINQALAIIRLNTQDILPGFLVTYLKSQYVYNQFQKKKQGVAQLNLSLKDISELEIMYPDIKKQERILKAIDKAKSLIDKRKEQIEACDELVKSLFHEMFGDPVKNDKGWETKEMEVVAPSSTYKGEFNDKVWLLNLDKIESNTGKILEYNYVDISVVGNSTCTFNEENVLYSKLRPYLNKVVIPNNIGYGTSELVALKPQKDILNRYFFGYLLRNDSFVAYISEKTAGAKMPRVSMSDFRKYGVITPPLPLQNKFAAQVEKIEHQKQLLEQSLKELENNFNSLMQRAFKGELF